MTVPLQLTNVYVQVRLHVETRASYEIDPALRAAEGKHDPNMLFQMGRKYLESRTSVAMEPAEAIAKATDKRCVIVGDPGAGKTTLLKRLALQAASQELAGLPDLPIHIELNAFAGSGFSDLLAFAAHTWQQRYGFAEDEIYGYMKERLAGGKALLLLDALDETVIGENVEAGEAAYKRVGEAIMQLATRYPHAPLVVTARKAGYHERTRLIGFSELEVLDFSPKDIREFVSNWFEHHPSPKRHATAEDLNTRLERSPRILALAANPLLLSLIVIVCEDNLDLPDRRSELYRQCVETLLTRWDTSRDIVRRRQFKPEQKQQLLEEVAWHFHAQGLRYFPKSELLTIIEDFLPTVALPAMQSNLILSEIAAESGLLKEQAQEWYGFLHLTLQEYFAARYAIAQNALETLLQHVGDAWWEEVLLLYAGGIRDASPLLERLLDEAGEDIFFSNLVTAGRCLAARPTVRNIALRSSIPSRLLDVLQFDRYSLNKQHAAEALVEIGRSAEEVNARLLSLLTNEKIDSEVRQSIASAMVNTENAPWLISYCRCSLTGG